MKAIGGGHAETGQAATMNRRKPRAERWAEILHVAAIIFFEKGYDATSLQDIADRVGILKGSIYYYIETKGDLLAHVLRDSHDAGLRNIQAVANGDGTPVARLADMIRAHTEFVCRDRARTAVFLHERKRLTPEQRKAFLGSEHAYSELFEGVIAEGQKCQMIRAEIDARLAALCMLGSLNSVYQWYRPSGRFSAAAIAEYFVAGALTGLTTSHGDIALSETNAPTKRRRLPVG